MRLPMTRWFAALLALLLWLPVGGAARAQTCTGSMPTVDFGTLSTGSGNPADVNATLSISCTGFATPYVRLCVGLGTAGSPSYDTRALTGSQPVKLNYNLYQDANRSVVFASVYDSQQRYVSVNLALSGGAGSTQVPVYGRVLGGQTSAPADTYSTTFATGDTLIDAIGYTASPPVCTTTLSNAARWTFVVRAVVGTTCSLSAANIDFGQLGVLTEAVNTTGVISTTCTNGAPYSLALNAGSSAGATVNSRKLTRSGGSDTLAYSLYRDAGRTQIWGDGTSGTSTVSVTGSGQTQTATVYATLPAQASKPVGTYSDTITVTVTF